MNQGGMSRDEVRRVAKLARLRLSPEEEALLGAQLGGILAAFERLAEVDTAGVEPMAHAAALKNVLRADEVRPSLHREQVLQNAPDVSEGFFRVPRLMEEE